MTSGVQKKLGETILLVRVEGCTQCELLLNNNFSLHAGMNATIIGKGACLTESK